MATLKDVAKLANVDVSTVSRALNNTSYVHPDTKERIYAAAREIIMAVSVITPTAWEKRKESRLEEA